MAVRLGPHHQQGGGALTVKMLRQATVATAVGDLGVLAEAPPGCVRIGRLDDQGALDGQGFDVNRYVREGVPPETMAAAYLAFWGSRVELNPWLDVIHGPNEQNPQQHTDPAAAMRWYGEFCYHFCRLVQAEGRRLGRRLRAGVGAFATGNPPDTNLLRHFTRALDGIRDFDGVYVQHCYADLDESNAFRYRAHHRLFVELGYPNIPHAVTECGAEAAGTMQPWVPQFGGNLSAYWDSYLTRLIIGFHQDGEWFLGGTLFTVGHPPSGWAEYDVAGYTTPGGQDLADLLAGFTPVIGDNDVNDLLKAKIREHLVAIDELLERDGAPPVLYRIRITATALNVRRGPGTSFDIVRQVRAGDELPVYEVHAVSGWLRIAQGDEWISGVWAYSTRV